jgi:hypothetical protein
MSAPSRADCDGPADATVCTRDNRLLAGEFAAAPIRLLPVVGLRQHLLGLAGHWLLLGREWRRGMLVHRCYSKKTDLGKSLHQRPERSRGSARATGDQELNLIACGSCETRGPWGSVASNHRIQLPSRSQWKVAHIGNKLRDAMA